MKWLVVAVIAVAVLGFLVRTFEAKFAFFPSAGENTTPADLGVNYEAATIATSDGERLRVWLLPHPTSLATIIYFHGNGGNLSVWTQILVGVQRQGYTVYALDYRGYGGSTGKPTERGLYRDVHALVAWVEARRPDRPLVYWGRSLGTTMAAYAATVGKPDGLILESGFADARSLLRGSPPMSFLALFSSYRFPTATLAARAAVPVLVMHGDADRVIPIANGRDLFARVPQPKQFVTIRGADHNDAAPADPRTYWNAVHGFVGGLSRSTAP
jgi:fermentation-respiration switch protein FrsA (DUF1100 family)